ncbi:MAG: hypothetical protein KC423_09295 [Anaerolineales bacterium]|nr:hypothetical protein [Anaerolineales bacterium]
MSIVAGVIIMGWFTYQEHRREQAMQTEAKQQELDDREQQTLDEWSTGSSDA